jgi:hypothetical protein
MATTLRQSSSQVSEVTKFAQTKKSVASSFKCQYKVDFFFWCWRDSEQGVCSSRKNSKSAVLLECVETNAWEPAIKTSREVAEWELVLAPWQCPTHTALITQQFLVKNEMVVVSQPPPPLTRPCSLWLFFVPTDEAWFERGAFSWCHRGSVRITGGPWQHFHWRF